MKFDLPDRALSSLPTGAVKDVVDTLGRRIARSAYRVGDTIPMETQLVAELGVSRTVVREAIKVLSGKGMVRTARRYGTRVCPFEEWHLLDPDVILWHGPDSPMAAQIYAASTEFRSLFEPEAAALAARNATPAQCDLIQQAAQQLDPRHMPREAMIGADFAFHSTILEASGNIMLGQLSGLVLALLTFSYQAGAKAAPDEQVSLRNHLSVAQAIRDRDPDVARQRMRAMLAQNRDIAERMGVVSGS